MDNAKFRKTVLAKMVRKNKWPIELLTMRQSSKFRNKKGQLYQLFKLTKKAK